MNDYSKAFLHLKKSDSLIKKKKINLNNTINTKIKNPKIYFKINKFKTDKNKDKDKEKDSSNKKIQYIQKLSANKYKKRTNSYIDKEKNNNTHNETISNNNKLKTNKSFNYRKNKSNITNKIIKKINENNKEHKTFFDNYEKNKIRKKMILNNRNYSHNNINNTITNNNNISQISQINEQKFANSYFNTLFNNDDNKNCVDNYFSLSQNIGKKKNSLLRKINTNLSKNNDIYRNKILNDENEYNRSQSNFYENKSKNALYSNYFFNIDNPNNNNNNVHTESNINNNEDNINSYNYISKNNNINNKIPSKQPIKLYNDNNTTINLAGSYNFNQYFNTIINNKNSKTNNSRNNNDPIINRNYNSNKTTIDNYNKKIYCNKYPQEQILSTKENDIKNNTFFINDKLIEEINEIKDEMIKNLMQNPTNSKSKKYNTLKHSFEKLLKLFNDYFYNNELNVLLTLLQKLLIGYHEVVCSFSSENRKLKELNYKLTEQYEKIDKDLIEKNKNIKEKQNKIDILEKKLYVLMMNIKINKINNNIKKFDEINLNNILFQKYKFRDNSDIVDIGDLDKEKKGGYQKNRKDILDDLNKGKNSQFNKIRKINENNLDDLDALYFFDKIEMKPQRSFSCGISFLPFDKLK